MYILSFIGPFIFISPSFSCFLFFSMSFRQRFTLIFLQPQTMATRTAVRAVGKIQGERRLIGYFTKNDIVADVFQHDISWTTAFFSVDGFATWAFS